jgi:hypothetical protein
LKKVVPVVFSRHAARAPSPTAYSSVPAMTTDATVK